jgi:hypothetical protein
MPDATASPCEYARTGVIYSSTAGHETRLTEDEVNAEPALSRVGLAGGTVSEAVLPAACRDQAAPQVGYITDQPGAQPAAV